MFKPRNKNRAISHKKVYMLTLQQDINHLHGKMWQLISEQKAYSPADRRSAHELLWKVLLGTLLHANLELDRNHLIHSLL